MIRTTVRDATYVLDGILDNQTELPIAKHTTDTAGYSNLVFALFDLLGLQFAPRLAGLPERRLYRPGPALDTPAGALLAHPLNLDLIRDGWDELVRCAASLKDGTVTANLLIARLQAAGARLPLTRALQEYGRLIKTRFVLGYLADETEGARSAASSTKPRACTRCTTGSSTAATAPSACTPSSANPPRRTACTSSPTRSSTGTRSTPSTPSTSSHANPPTTSSPPSPRPCSSASMRSAPTPSTPTAPPDSSAPSANPAPRELPLTHSAAFARLDSRPQIALQQRRQLPLKITAERFDAAGHAGFPGRVAGCEATGRRASGATDMAPIAYRARCRCSSKKRTPRLTFVDAPFATALDDERAPRLSPTSLPQIAEAVAQKARNPVHQSVVG